MPAPIYRVVADRDVGDDPRPQDIRDGDRYVLEAPFLGDTRIVRIERPAAIDAKESECVVRDLRTLVADLVPLSMVDGRDRRANVFEVADEIIAAVVASVQAAGSGGAPAEPPLSYQRGFDDGYLAGKYDANSGVAPPTADPRHNAMGLNILDAAAGQPAWNGPTALPAARREAAQFAARLRSAEAAERAPQGDSRVLLDAAEALEKMAGRELDNHHNATMCPYCTPDPALRERPVAVDLLRDFDRNG